MRSRNQLASIEYQQTLVDDFDGLGGEWVEYSPCYVDVRPLTGRELIQAQQVESQITHRVETEFIAGVNTRMRLSVGGKTYNILSAINVNDANRTMELMCVEKV